MALDSRNYHGEVFVGPNQFYASLPRVPIRHTGQAELDLFLWANSFCQTAAFCMEPFDLPLLAAFTVTSELAASPVLYAH